MAAPLSDALADGEDDLSGPDQSLLDLIQGGSDHHVRHFERRLHAEHRRLVGSQQRYCGPEQVIRRRWGWVGLVGSRLVRETADSGNLVGWAILPF